MIDFDFIVHYSSYSVPTFPIWDNSLQYLKVQIKVLHSIKSTTFYFVPIISYGVVSTTGMGLGRV